MTELARQEASGAPQVGGDPGGIIYLSGGRLAFAESEVVPDLGSRLVNSRRLRVDQWLLAQRDSLAGYDIAPGCGCAAGPGWPSAARRPRC